MMMRGVVSLVLAAAGCAAVTAAVPSAAAAQSGSLLVISKASHTIADVDTGSLAVKWKAPTGEDPHEAIASSDGRLAYVSNYGGGALHTLGVIDLKTGRALQPIDLGALTGPHGLTYVSGELYFTAEGAKVLGRFNPATHKVDMVVGTGQNRTHMIYVSPNAKHMIATNVASGTVSLMDEFNVPAPPPGSPNAPAPGMPPRVDWTQTVVKVGGGSEGFDVSPDGHEVWVANAADGTVSVIDWLKKTVVATIDAKAKSANRIKFTLDGKFALVSELQSTDLVVLDAKKRTVVKRIPMGRGAAGILMEPNGKRAFIACTPDNTVAVLDLATMTVKSHIDVGGEPDGMAWAPEAR